MDFCLVKSGAAMFDMLHAYGLGILLAHASGLPIELQDGVTVSTLTCSLASIPPASFALLDDILALPTGEEVLALPTDCRREASLEVSNLDGLLAMLFTSPGVRASSVGEVLRKSRLDRCVAEQAVRKVRTAYGRWKAQTSQQTRGAGNWLEWLRGDYDPSSPAIPEPKCFQGRVAEAILSSATWYLVTAMFLVGHFASSTWKHLGKLTREKTSRCS